MSGARFTTYLAYVGCFFMVLYIVVSLALYHTTHGFKHSVALEYMLYMGFLLQVPGWGYKLWHYKAYKEENKHRLISWAVLAAVVVLFLIFKG